MAISASDKRELASLFIVELVHIAEGGVTLSVAKLEVPWASPYLFTVLHASPPLDQSQEFDFDMCFP